MKRLKGWWPCVNLEGGDAELTVSEHFFLSLFFHGQYHRLKGKIELELEILTEEEAREKPAGRAREEPNDNPTLEAPQ